VYKLKDLTINYGGIEFKNPIVAVSGPLGRTYEALKRSIEAGVSAVTLKSCNMEQKEEITPKPGCHVYPRPAHTFLRKYGLKDVMINWEGVPVDFTAEKEAKLIERIKPIAKKHDCRIIANLHPDPMYMRNPEVLRKDIRIIEETGPDLFEFCPCTYHFPPGITCIENINFKAATKNYTSMYDIIADEVNIPIVAKLVFGIAHHGHKTLNRYGIKNFHVTEGPHFHGTVIDIDSMEPLVPGPEVFMYGKLRRPIMNLMCARTKNLGDNDVESSGGVWTIRDSIERLMCGASLVGLHTAIQSKGHKLFGEIINGVAEFLDEKSMNLNDIIGVAIPKIVSYEEHENFMLSRDLSPEEIKPVIDLDTCTGCGLCANCIHGGIDMENGKPELNLDNCVRCGVCESLCPVDAIVLQKV
jgi:Pyruvate/2-oxoacid:ferredoxin oxidoreductase delta subunit